MNLTEEEMRALVDLGIRLENMSEEKQYLIIKKSLINQIIKTTDETAKNMLVDLLNGLEEDYSPRSN